MKNSLWITAAAAALLATSYAAAQNMPKAGQDAPAATQSRPAGQGAGNTGGINAPNAATEDSEHPTKKGVKGASDESQPPRKGQKIGQERPAKGGAQTTQDRRQGAGTETRTDRDRQGDRRETTGARPSGGQVNVQISGEQRTRVRETVFKGRPNRVSRVDFNLSVGTAVPRSSIELVPVPQDVVEVVPEYEGYLYFVVNDEIVIVDPDSYEIVAVIAA